MENRVEGNMIIAQFMGLKNVCAGSWRDSEFVYLAEDDSGRIDYTDGINILSYNADWSQLMQVVDKIESIDMFEVSIRSLMVTVHSIHPLQPFKIHTEGVLGTQPKIEAVYKCVVEFIKWFNKHPKNNALTSTSS
jgi:hypothetical protein